MWCPSTTKHVPHHCNQNTVSCTFVGLRELNCRVVRLLRGCDEIRQSPMVLGRAILLRPLFRSPLGAIASRAQRHRLELRVRRTAPIVTLRARPVGVNGHAGQKAEGGLEAVAELLVHPAVDERVDEAVRHRDQMDAEVNELDEGEVEDGRVDVLDEVEGVDRQIAQSEDENDRGKHLDELQGEQEKKKRNRL